jgi:5S rRNA maturation endonuclease (ribonuclease M5)
MVMEKKSNTFCDEAAFSGDNELKDLFVHQLTKIEDIAGRLFHHKFESAQDLWTIQTDLAGYQIKLRGDIRKEQGSQKETKTKIAEIASRREGNWKDELQEFQRNLQHSDRRIEILEHALDLSKQFGDALVWILFKGAVHKIVALSTNKPNPPIPEDLSLQVMLRVAEGLANADAGFPIIHDVTNCLRVGDLTFCDMLNDDAEPLTVEVKSKVLNIDGNIANMAVNIYAPAVQPRFVEVFEKINRSPILIEEKPESAELERTANGASKRLLGSGPRLQRQVERMARSRKLQTTAHLETIDQHGNDVFAKMVLEMKGRYFHWDVIKDLCLEAKTKGYATRAVDDAFFYTVIYSKDGFAYPGSKGVDLPFATEVSEEIKKSFPLCANSSNNQICFRSTWDYLFERVPSYVRPFLMYNVPIDLRFDIMWRRLSIVVYMNLGKIVEALARAGIDARLPANEDELNRLFIPVSYMETVDDGAKVEIHGGSLNEFATKVGLEFMSLEGFVSCVLQTMKASIELTKCKTKENQTAQM